MTKLHVLRRRRTATPILNGATLLSGANARDAPNSCGGTPDAPLQTLVELPKPPRRVRWERAPFRDARSDLCKQISSRRMRGGVIGKDLRALLFGTVYRRWNFAENTRMVPRTAHITRRLMNSLAFIEPRFLCTQTPKHTVSLKRPKYTLCEKKFRYELKLGRESTNPTFKGTPQPPL